MRVCWGSLPCAADFRVSSRPPLSPVVSCDVMYRGQEGSQHKQHPSNFLLFLHKCCSKGHIIKENVLPRRIFIYEDESPCFINLLFIKCVKASEYYPFSGARVQQNGTNAFESYEMEMM